jgi:phospholipase C
MWQYAQHFAMSDNAYADTYGPSTPGALAVVSGQNNGMRIIKTTKKPPTVANVSYYIDDGQGGITMINDVDPGYDSCSVPADQAMMEGKNIGDLLNAGGITWGGFMGGFNLDATNANGTKGCGRSTYSQVVGTSVVDYIPHHNWFQYYQSTANPTHARPSSLQTIGYSFESDGKTPDPANHEYGLRDFYDAVKGGNFPAVSYIKLPAFQDGHAGYSNPLDEQMGTTALINILEQQPDWNSTAVIVTWDDSDGWYDHRFAPTTNPSFDAQADQLDGAGKCGSGTPLAGVDGKPVNGRCGPGTRIPFVVISPWTKANAVSHDPISQASVVRFIEDNWLHGARLGGGSLDATAGSIMSLFDFTSGGHNPPLYLSPTLGTPLASPPTSN